MKQPPRRFRFGPMSSVAGDALTKRRTAAVETLFSAGFPYSRKMTAHVSCVNSLSLSSGEGRFLASGGDDPYVYIWDLHQETLEQPACGVIGHKGNVFSLTFSASNEYVFSGDTDGIIHMYDMARVGTAAQPAHPLRSFSRHENSVRCVSSHPENENLFLSASEDGTIKLHDARVNTGEAPGVMSAASDFSSVHYHPTLPHLFVTGTNRGSVCLRDVRSSFGYQGYTRLSVATTYVTPMSKSSLHSRYVPEVASVTFDRTGSKLAVTMLFERPSIYDFRDPLPLATCSGLNAPDGTPIPENKRTYSNCCTIKHGSFGGAGLDTECYYSAGSDDFRGYVWKIPDLEELRQRREMIAYERWQHLQDADEHGQARPPIIGFAGADHDPRCVPVDLSTPLFRLGGHKSIVNSTLIHPRYPIIFTSGVERHILLHSALPSTHCQSDLPRTPETVRSLPGANRSDAHLFVRALLAGRTDDGEDRETIALFDHILREEGDQDLFDVPDRIWASVVDEDERADVDDDDDDMYM